MRTIKRPGEHEIEIKRSRFRCALEVVRTEEEAREFIALQRRRHHEARHHCSAFVLGDDGRTQKSNDDGEPAGTAGTPMLEVLRRNDITNTVAVVIRYFGGVLLGAGGLVRAYGGAVSAALEEVGLVDRRPVRVVSTTVDHALAGRLDNDLRSAGYQVIGTDYAERARLRVLVAEDGVADFRTWLAEATGGTATAEVGDRTHVED
ncbi:MULTISPECIES: YigZ family protein [Saccharopolyspora]|uniref:YigZ family protein n=1 Tax=Saccharopolyspora cebuensis TaxID=418759 RepID=A0ABV4CMV0_9PSEU